jgi:hypothetical protein
MALAVFDPLGSWRQSFFEPGFQCFDKRPGFLLLDSLALIGAPAADFGFNLVELHNPPQLDFSHFGRKPLKRLNINQKFKSLIFFSKFLKYPKSSSGPRWRSVPAPFLPG